MSISGKRPLQSTASNSAAGRVTPGSAPFHKVTELMDSIDKILTEYQLRRETAAKIITNSMRFNWVDLADEIGVSEDTVHNYRRAFLEMSEAERLRVTAVLAHDRFAEVVDDDK